MKLESSVDETVRLKDLGQEVNKIRPFLRSNPDQQSGALAHIQRYNLSKINPLYIGLCFFLT